MDPLNKLWTRVLDQDLVEGVCKACSNKLGALKDSEKQGLTLLGDMSGHPSMLEYRNNDFEIITF